MPRPPQHLAVDTSPEFGVSSRSRTQLAHLVAPQRQPRAVVPLHPQLDPKGGAETWGRFERRRRVAEPYSRESIDGGKRAAHDGEGLGWTRASRFSHEPSPGRYRQAQPARSPCVRPVCRTSSHRSAAVMSASSFPGFGSRPMRAYVLLPTTSATRPSASTTAGAATTIDAKTATTNPTHCSRSSL